MDPLIREGALGDAEKTAPPSLRYLAEQLSASWKMDRSFWYPEDPEDGYDAYMQPFISLADGHFRWMRDTLAKEDFRVEKIFFDMPEGAWYRDAVTTAARRGLPVIDGMNE